MRRGVLGAASAALLVAGVALAQGDAMPGAGYVHVVEVDGMITSATQQLIESAHEQAEANEAALLLIELDTPGGLVDATRGIVQQQLNATVPIAVYVRPRGARAGSAGVFMTLAAHVAAMAPATNIGAAHPVMISPGGAPADDGKGDSNRDHMARKIEQDTVAWVEGIAEARGRNVEWARKAVLESVSITSDRALEINVIDLIAPNRAELLETIHDRTVETTAGEITLSTEDAPVHVQEMTAKQRFVQLLSNPTVLSILFLLMLLGFYAEVNNPGSFVGGGIGVVCLVLFAVGSQFITLNILGGLLILTGFVLFFLEVQVVSFGLLTIGGMACVLAGIYFLVDRMEFTAPPIQWMYLVPVVGSLMAITLILTWLAVKAHLPGRKADLSDMIGEIGEAKTDLEPTGQIFLMGAWWSAQATQPVKQGELVRVVALKGLRLTVEPARETPEGGSAPSDEPEVS